MEIGTFEKSYSTKYRYAYSWHINIEKNTDMLIVDTSTAVLKLAFVLLKSCTENSHFLGLALL